MNERTRTAFDVRPKIVLRRLGFLIAMVLVVEVAFAADAPDYNREIKPLLAEKCFACHSALKQEGGLRLDAISLIRQGGDSGAAILPRKAADSPLLQRVRADDLDLRMPPSDAGHPLSDKQIALIEAWIAKGAVAPDEPIPLDPSQHWAFQPPRKSQVPLVDAGWVRTEIDHFLADQQHRLGLVAVGEARPSLLLRRAYLDLIGLPPSGEDLQTFLNDESPDAWEKAIDRLFDSPRYGERWARHFMDIWRYSDPSGYGAEIRDGRKHTWRWRDWIVDSLNQDKGYDRMVVEMLAADEAAPSDLDALRATGFLARNWYKFNRNVWLDNIVEHSSKAFLGLTVNCARCHDHKYDPVGHHEYYQMRAFFEPHQVRDEPLSPGSTAMLVRTYDANATTPTFPFFQGDENRPDKDHPLQPGVPATLGGQLTIEPIALPVTAYYPSLREDQQEQLLAAALEQIDVATSALAKAERAAKVAAEALAAKPPSPTKASDPIGSVDIPSETEPSAVEKTVLADRFDTLDTTRWTMEGGRWSIREGRLVQSLGETVQHRMVSRLDHPRDFRARLRLRITGGEMWRSVGLGFDGDGKAMNAVYLSAYAGGGKAQVTLQNASGSWAYPTTGAVPREVRLDQDYTLEILVRDRLMNVLIDDVLQVAFTLPERRTSGKLVIFTFSAVAEFDEVRLATLDAKVPLKAATSGAPVSASAPRSLTDVHHEATAAVEAARHKLQLARAEHVSLEARLAAEKVKYGLSAGDQEALSRAAGKAARQLTISRHQEQIAAAKYELAKTAGRSAGDPKLEKAAAAARQKLDSQSKQLAAAQEQLDSGSSEYPPVGPIHPTSSTGRRLALARWIVARDNPLAARVLVNHVWLRHFDAPLVERMFDFGLRSSPPQHAALLDWLAVQFMEDGWSLKALHRRIMLSAAYRLKSSAASSGIDAATAQANVDIDPDNLALWRMNPRRMEAEVARDSLLFLGGSLDATMGGPPIDHNLGQKVARRSLYFRQDKERQMTFLSLFDGAKVNECYRRKATVAPQQALAMFNSPIAWEQAGKLAAQRAGEEDEEFIAGLFEDVLCRTATSAEVQSCQEFLEATDDHPAARRQLALVLLNHNDFVTVR